MTSGTMDGIIAERAQAYEVTNALASAEDELARAMEHSKSADFQPPDAPELSLIPPDKSQNEALIHVMILDLCGDRFTVNWANRQAVFAELEAAFESFSDDYYLISFEYMTQTEYDSLPEFEGF